jgi:hypothetical protein
MRLLVSLSFLIIIFSNCSTRIPSIDNEPNELIEGAIYYNITGEQTTSGWDFKVYFDPNNVRVEEKYALTASKTYIYNKTSKEILGLINDFSLNYKMKDSYFIYYSPDKLIRQALSSNYGKPVIKETSETKLILGYNCRKTIINHGNQAVVEVWTTDKIKPSLILPWTPLTYENIALEYELRVLGTVYQNYTATSIIRGKQDKKLFDHQVPNEYYLVVPFSVFSFDPTWTKDYEENKFTSFTYPYFSTGRDATKQYLKKEITKILKEGELDKISLEFTVTETGNLTNIEVDCNYSQDNRYLKKIKKFLQDMPRWTPAKVMGNSVKSKVSIAF